MELLWSVHYWSVAPFEGGEVSGSPSVSIIAYSSHWVVMV